MRNINWKKANKTTGKTNPISYCLQQASLKSVTGDISAWIGRPLNQRVFSFCTALAASFS